MKSLNNCYKLVDKRPVPLDSYTTLDPFDTEQQRSIALNQLHDGVLVSTVFLSVPRVGKNQELLFFETTIFGGARDGFIASYGTYQQAEAGHLAALQLLEKNNINP